eukprot:gene10951-biopygen6328
MRPYRRRATDARREKWTCVFVSEAACWKSRGCFAVQTNMHTYKHMHTCTRTYTMRRAPRPSRPPPPSAGGPNGTGGEGRGAGRGAEVANGHGLVSGEHERREDVLVIFRSGKFERRATSEHCIAPPQKIPFS